MKGYRYEGDEVNIESLIAEHPKMRYVDVLEALDRKRTISVWDRSLAELFRKHIYCKKWNTAPPYDPRDKRWLDVSRQIERCIEEVNAYERAVKPKEKHGDNIRQGNPRKRARRKANPR